MAIDMTEFPNTIKAGLKTNSKYDKFFYRFKVDKKTYRGTFDYSTKAWTKKDRISNAEIALLKIKKESEQSIDSDMKVDAAINMYLETLKIGTYRTNLKSYYDRKVKTHIGSKKVKVILPAHIQKIINKNVEDGDKELPNKP